MHPNKNAYMSPQTGLLKKVGSVHPSGKTVTCLSKYLLTGVHTHTF